VRDPPPAGLEQVLDRRRRARTGSILAFDRFYILTNGGPDNSTVTVVLAIYRQAFFLFDLGKGAALSIIVLVILLALNIVQFRILRTSEEG
jgi:multiple sugar transport system permease protein